MLLFVGIKYSVRGLLCDVNKVLCLTYK